MKVMIEELGDDLFIPIPQVLLDELGWTVDDTLVWKVTLAGVAILRKVEE
jgi:hypothetical protein